MTRDIGVAELRRNLRQVLDQVSEGGEVVYVTKGERRIVALVPVTTHTALALPEEVTL